MFYKWPYYTSSLDCVNRYWRGFTLYLLYLFHFQLCIFLWHIIPSITRGQISKQFADTCAMSVSLHEFQHTVAGGIHFSCSFPEEPTSQIHPYICCEISVWTIHGCLCHVRIIRCHHNKEVEVTVQMIRSKQVKAVLIFREHLLCTFDFGSLTNFNRHLTS